MKNIRWGLLCYLSSSLRGGKTPFTLYMRMVFMYNNVRLEEFYYEFMALVRTIISNCFALVSIFGKIGLDGIDANVATTVRSIIMALFMVGVIIIQGKFQNIGDVLLNKKHCSLSH